MIIVPHLRYATRKAGLQGEVSVAIVLEPWPQFLDQNCQICVGTFKRSSVFHLKYDMLCK